MTTRLVSWLRTAGWAAGALLFGVLLSSPFHLDDIPVWVPVAFFALAALTAARPLAGVVLAGAGTPIVWYTVRSFLNAPVSWPEMLACAVALGWCVRRALGRGAGMPGGVAAPTAILAAIVLASSVAGTAVAGVPLGPAFAGDLTRQLTQLYFEDLRSFLAVHAGLRLLEGLVLLAAASSVARENGRAARTVAIAVAAGAACASLASIGELAASAAEHGEFWRTLLVDLARVRYNVHYADLNAAGSYFVAAAIAAVGAARASTGRLRVLLSTCAVMALAGLWMSGSRTAMLAGIVAAAGATMLRRIRRSGAPMRAVLIGTAALVLLALTALYMPLRGTQRSSATAVEVRIGMARAGTGMIAEYPVFGVGVGEFPERSGEFATPELLALFPRAAHENAHNDFIQVAAELGLPGLVAFVWLLGSAVAAAERNVWADRARAGLLVATIAFMLTSLGGHPLLIREAAFPFWILLGTAVGAGAGPAARAQSRWVRWVTALALLAIVVTVPWRINAMLGDAELEHIGIGVSVWQTSPDGIRYREAAGAATLFVPASTAIRFGVKLQSDRPADLELRLDGRVADVVTLSPRAWNDLELPARTERPTARYARMELRLLDADRTPIWITKVQPIR